MGYFTPRKEIAMLLDTYETQGLFYNVNFKEAAGSSGLQAFRGDLVLVEGEIADAQGRRKPPTVGMTGAVLLADAEKLKLLAGFLGDIADIEPLLARYRADFAADMRAVLYVVNIPKPMIADVEGLGIVLLPLADGMVWNELVDELALEKSDFKGQGAGEKVLTVFGAFKDYKPKYESLGLEAALARRTDAKRESRGPV